MISDTGSGTGSGSAVVELLIICLQRTVVGCVI